MCSLHREQLGEGVPLILDRRGAPRLGPPIFVQYADEVLRLMSLPLYSIRGQLGVEAERRLPDASII